MKITKEEKTLWNFLNIFKNIFSKTTNRTIIFGSGADLYLYTLNYYGKFTSLKTVDQLMPDYNFGYDFYELKQLPNGRFVLDIIDNPLTSAEFEKILHIINNKIEISHFIAELRKQEEYKIAKITNSSHLLMSDNDLKFINSFPFFEVRTDNESLTFKSNGITDDDVAKFETYLIYDNLESTYTIQQKMEIQKEIDQSAEDDIDDLTGEIENLEEFEDEFNPMEM